MQRRGFLAAGVGGILATGATVEDKPKFEIIDTNSYFYDPTRPQCGPWPGKDNNALYHPVLRYELVASDPKSRPARPQFASHVVKSDLVPE